MFRIAVAALSFAMTVVLATPLSAWEGELSGYVRTIAEVREKAQSGDFVVIEGRVTDVREGDGSILIVTFEDDTGSLPLVVPNHLQRQLAGGTPQGGVGPSGADPQIGARARVGGQWNHKPMDDDTWGIRVQRVERIEN
jgi:hypothetical protein